MMLSSTLDRRVPLFLFPLLVLIVLALSPTVARAQRATDTCLQGYVWREAFANDHVCVTPETRQQAADDNAQAGSRVDPSGPYGPDTCIRGYVWREASPTDHVCVTAQVRQQTVADNAQSQHRHMSTPARSIHRADAVIGAIQHPVVQPPQGGPSTPIPPTPCDVATITQIFEDGSVEVEIRHPDGVIERKTKAGTTTIYPDGRSEFRRADTIEVAGQAPNPPQLSNDSNVLQKWREYHAESLLDVFRTITNYDSGMLKGLTDKEGNMTLYQKINYRTAVIEDFLRKRQ